MKELQDRIIAYVTAKQSLVSLERLLAVSAAKGFSEGEVLAALSDIGNKLKSTVRGGEVYYQVPPPEKKPKDHLAWVRTNYPAAGSWQYGEPIPFYSPEFDGPTEIYTKETDIFYREKNEELKKQNRANNSNRNTKALTSAQRAVLSARTTHL